MDKERYQQLCRKYLGNTESYSREDRDEEQHLDLKRFCEEITEVCQQLISNQRLILSYLAKEKV